jgi:hypothetical protein
MVDADMEGLVVRPVPGKGRGVFAERDFDDGEIVERCPVVVIPNEQYPQYSATMLEDYGFRWPQKPEVVVIPLGYGCIYNHSPAPSIRFVANFKEQAIDFVCTKPITAGEEITQHYGWRRSRVPAWYEDSWDITAPTQPFQVSPTVAVAAVGAVAVGGAAAVIGTMVAVARRARRFRRRRPSHASASAPSGA